MKQIAFSLILGCFVSLFVFLPSCNKYEWNESNIEYLSISNADLETLSGDDVKIIVSALGRLSIRECNDGFWYTQVQSHSEVNMSEELFGLVKSIIFNHNRGIIQVRSLNLDGSTDCVLQSLAYLNDYSYPEIYFYVESRYDGVVTVNNVEKIIRHFYPSCETYYPDSLSGNEGFNIDNTVGYFQAQEYYHMVNIFPYSPADSIVVYYDAQNGTVGGNRISDFRCFFKVK